MKPNQEQNNLLSFLEGEIKYDEEENVVLVNGMYFCGIALSNKFDIHEAGNLIAQLLINERERRKKAQLLSPSIKEDLDNSDIF